MRSSMFSAWRRLLSNPLEDRECFEQPIGKDRHLSGNEQYSRYDKESAHGHLDLVHMSLEARNPIEEAAGKKSGEQERNPDSERIDRQQAGAPRGRSLRTGNEQDRRQHRPDTGRPAEGEGEPHDVGADQAGRLPVNLDARLAIEQRDTEDAEKMQAHDHDDDAGINGENGALLRPRPAYCAVGGAYGVADEQWSSDYCTRTLLYETM